MPKSCLKSVGKRGSALFPVLVWLAIGFIIYFAYSRQRSRIGQPGYMDITRPEVVSHRRDDSDDDPRA